MAWIGGAGEVDGVGGVGEEGAWKGERGNGVVLRRGGRGVDSWGRE